MRPFLKILAVFLVAALPACEDDEDLGFTGVFNLFLFETSDTCDGIANDNITSQAEITGTVDDLQVRFGDDAILTGGLNDLNQFQVSGDVTITLTVNGLPVQVDSFMEMIFEIKGRGRRLEVEDARLTFDGTHPESPGETCVQELRGTGQRPSSSPVL